jgi:hypothetical protein
MQLGLSRLISFYNKRKTLCVAAELRYAFLLRGRGAGVLALLFFMPFGLLQGEWRREDSRHFHCQTRQDAVFGVC